MRHPSILICLILVACGQAPTEALDQQPATPPVSPLNAAPESPSIPTTPGNRQTDEVLAGYLGPNREIWNRTDMVMRTLALRPGDVVADVGAGSGYFTFLLAEAVGPTGRVYAPDIDPNAIRFLQDRISKEWDPARMAPIVCALSQSEDVGIPVGVLDQALMVDTHFYAKDPLTDGAGTLKTLYAAMKPGGIVSIIEAKVDPLGPQDPELARAATRKNMTAAGFVEVDHYTYVMKHFFLKFQKAP